MALDLGVIHSCAFSDRTYVPLPVATPAEQAWTAPLQRQLSKQQKGSQRRRKAVRRLAQFQRHIANRVPDRRHQLTPHLAKNHRLVFGEELAVRNMSGSAQGTIEEPGTQIRQKAGLNRSILAQGWQESQRQLKYKCPWQGGHFLQVPARGTSQRCSVCGDENRANRPTIRPPLTSMPPARRAFLASITVPFGILPSRKSTKKRVCEQARRNRKASHEQFEAAYLSGFNRTTSAT
jgi:putative transposase